MEVDGVGVVFVDSFEESSDVLFSGGVRGAHESKVLWVSGVVIYNVVFLFGRKNINDK